MLKRQSPSLLMSRSAEASIDEQLLRRQTFLTP
jgi:hypothetical protein